MSFKKPPSVAVIGAGLAGLTAAYRLEQKGISPVIFEARDRPGGRVLTHYEGSSYEELGGKFLDDGGDALSLRSLLKELAVDVATKSLLVTRLYYKEGKALPTFTLYENAPLPSEENYLSLVAKSKKSKNILEVLRWFFAGHEDLLQLFVLRMTNYEGSPAEHLGVYCLDLFWKFYTWAYEDYQDKIKGLDTFVDLSYIKDGGSKLIEALCKKIKTPISYHSPLKKISLSRAGQIELEFADGMKRSFDKVILAIPCSTLRDIEIQDGLFPKDQLHAIQTLQYGSVTKILVPVKVHSKEIPNFSSGPDFVTWFNEDNTWMTWYFGGDAGHFNPENSQELEKKIADSFKVITVLYPGLEMRGKPTSANWSLEPYSKGAYSNFGIDQHEPFTLIEEVLGETVKKVFRPIGNKIFFAGEHTGIEYHGTMEAAVHSGDRAASMLAKSF
ncbi:MAG: FAD-dependent oxidoreductase [Chlamydiae bacterium]|nr:FAD-dependent oxidoreductase [Chlamydiota bacterium]